ncbi:MAG: aminopeptidase [Flavobacteriales bacterium]|nr:aminopeptidase [Flavobacteriales bacterium]|tara:strand:- start:23950 stop:24969 length:1020 start_codon:yes stop_codon:yes gene_type:complete
MIKKILILFFLLIIGYLVYHYKSVIYGLGQAVGQAEVLWNANEIEDLMKNPDFPDSTKQKFRYIQEVKQFAQDSLGLNSSKNYSTFYDQNNKPILWVVTASPEFEIKAYEWRFPIAGKFSYKGFFDYQKAKEEAENLKEMGYDTKIDEVNAWSTLGWFKDPILSSMLNRSAGSLAELIIHELSHATVYRKNQVEFNENFATFVGKKGAENFLTYHYGKNSNELKEYLNNEKRSSYFKEYMHSATKELIEVYANFKEGLSIEEKRKIKSTAIENFKNRLANSSYYQDSLEADARLSKFHPNNAYFSGFLTYHAKQNNFEERLKEEFNGDLKSFIKAIKEE